MRRQLSALAAALVLAAGPGAAVAAAGPAGGQAWTNQDVPLPAGGHYGSAGAISCPSVSDCVQVGAYTTHAGRNLPLAEAWNGQAWVPQEVPSQGSWQFPGLEAVSCASATRCMAVGTFNKGTGIGREVMLSEQDNGSTWTAQTAFPDPAGGKGGWLDGVWCLTAANCTAVGTYFTSTGRHPVAEHWDGQAWASQSVPNPDNSADSYLTGITCVSADSCLAVGFYTAGPITAEGKPLTARWNGHAWTLLSTPLPAAATNGGTLDAVSCSSAADCTAVGAYWNTKAAASDVLAEHWNGSAWTIQDAPSPSTISPVEDQLDGVWCVSVSRCTAVGFFDDHGNLQGTRRHGRALIEYWNGSAWSVRPTAEPTANQFLGGVACASASTCTVAGGVSHDGGQQYLPLAERD